MRTLLLLAALTLATRADAKVLNVEFKFTPFTGDLKADHVDTVAGRARILLDGVPVAVQRVDARTVPVLFDEREVGPAVWVPTESLGAAVRHGKNHIRFEFEPQDAHATYKVQLRWATVTDQTHHDDEPGGARSTNQEDEGAIDREVTGPVTLERDFDADFAKDQPWHHFPPVTTLTDDDTQKVTALVTARVAAFKPDFAPLYAILKTMPNVRVADVKKLRCLEKAYAAGVRVPGLTADQLEFTPTGNPEVIVRRKGGDLFTPDPTGFEKIKGDEAQMCAGMMLAMLFPPHLVVVRQPDGSWKVPY